MPDIIISKAFMCKFDNIILCSSSYTIGGPSSFFLMMYIPIIIPKEPNTINAIEKVNQFKCIVISYLPQNCKFTKN